MRRQGLEASLEPSSVPSCVSEQPGQLVCLGKWHIFREQQCRGEREAMASWGSRSLEDLEGMLSHLLTSSLASS